MMITLFLPADTSLAVPSDPTRWERRNGHIIATYARKELAVAVGLALGQKREMLETRLSRGLQVMRAATGCDDAKSDRLLAHWDALNAEYAEIVTKLAAVTYQIEEV
ncbi:MAG: hypothetical protein GY832_35480 [Chloroflexi bacterium]|nr:hypothetical protein [Chloroflexota bacterium]